MGSRYGDGTKLENLSRNQLQRYGYITMRSAGSKGAVDIVAIRTNKLLFIQCKYTRNLEERRLSSICPLAERKKIIAISLMVNAIPLVCYNPLGGRKDSDPAYWLLEGQGPYDYRDWLPE